MELKEAFEVAKRRFSKYGSVFVEEDLVRYDHLEKDVRELRVSIVFNDRCRKITDDPCWAATSLVGFKEIFAELEARLTALEAYMKEPAQ